MRADGDQVRGEDPRGNPQQLVVPQLGGVDRRRAEPARLVDAHELEVGPATTGRRCG
jgi:hypothetical protein